MGRIYGSTPVILNVAKKARRYVNSRALVPYRKPLRALVRYKRPAFAAAAAGVGYLSTMPNGRMSIARARGVTQRIWNRRTSYKRKQRKDIGERVGSDRTRSTNAAENRFLADTRILYVVPLIQNIVEGTGNSARFRDLINVRGFKLRMQFRNLSNSGMYLNIAVIHPKQGNDVSLVDFFRDNGGDRALDFGIARTSLDFATRNINNDRYSILAHKRYRLGGNAPLAGQSIVPWPNTDATRLIQFYTPLKKQIRYDNDGVAEEEFPIHQVFLVYWCDNVNKVGGDPVVNDVLEHQYRYTTYFRNTKD